MAPTRTKPSEPVVRTTTQGARRRHGHGVRYVLVISTTAVVVIFGALWLFYSTKAAASAGRWLPDRSWAKLSWQGCRAMIGARSRRPIYNGSRMTSEIQ